MRLLSALIVALLAMLTAACGGEEEQPPTGPTSTRSAVAVTPDGGLSGTMVWQGVTYLHMGDLAADAVGEENAERLGEAELGPDRLPLEVYRWQEGRPWELLSKGPEGWLIWEPLAVGEASRQLSALLDLSLEQIQVQAVEGVEWPDSCLGAGAPGEVCAEVITPGFRITLAAGGDEYEYRSDREGRVREAP